MKPFSDHSLLEREGELAVIAEVLDAAGDGSGSCLTLEGPAGVGKTRLLDATRQRAQDDGFRVLAARAGEREREYAWGVARSLFEPVVTAASAAEQEQLFANGASSCRALLEGAPLTTEGSPDSSFAIFSGLHALCRELSTEEPLLLAIDDLHWVDGPSLGFLDFLGRRLEQLPIAVVCSLRPNEPGADIALIASLTAELNGSRVHPQPLSREASAQVLRARLGTETDAGLLDEGHQVTGGNPLLLSELARTVEVEGGAGASLAGSLATLGSKAVSRTVAVRLDRAGQDGRRLATAAAVFGEDALLGHAIELAGLDADAADAASLALVRLEVLRPGSRVQFVHPVIRAAVYESLGAPERERLHRRAAELLESVDAPAEQLAGHLLEVEPRADQGVVATLREAAVKAAAGGDSRSATLLMRRALAEPPAEEIRTDLLTQLGAAELLVDGPSAAEHLKAALERITQPAYQAAITELLARALIFQERIPEAIEVCDRTLRSVREAGEPLLERRIEAVLVETTMIDPPEAGELHVSRAARLLRAARPGEDYGSRAMLSLSAIAGARDLSMTASEAVERSRSAAEGGILIREGMNGVAQLGPAQTLAMAGHCAESIGLLEESLRWDERFGSVFGHLSNLIFRARARLFAGQLEGAIADTDESLRLSKAYGIVPGIAWSAAILAESLLLAGDRERCEAVLDAEVPREEPAPDGWHWMNFMVARARMLLARGEADAALTEARRGGTTYSRNLGVGPTWLSWRPVAAEAELARDNAAAAAGLAGDELTLARQWGAPRQIGTALRVLAAAEGGGRAIELLEEAVAVLEPSEARLDLAWALIDLGAAQRRANRKADSREPLKRGMDLAHDCGSAALAERARTELRASGVRARRTALSGPESLTESERRVVDLAVAGRSNREIAGELFVTIKTVEVHLSSAYRKLEVRGRRELAAAIAPAA